MSSNSIANDYFNQMKQSFLDKISNEDKEKYKKFGEAFFNSFDLEKGCPIPDSFSLEESLAYIIETIKSGLHPNYLSIEEKSLVQAAYGDDWYKKFGYDSLDS